MLDWLAERLFGSVIETRVRQAVKVVDDRWWSQVGGATMDRSGVEQQDVFKDALDAWRVNPLARRIVRLTTDYVVGGGIEVDAGVGEAWREWVAGWWRDNEMALRLAPLCDELTRAGELFVILFGTTVRVMPAAWIRAVDTDPDDYERELGYWQADAGTIQGRYWKGRAHPDLRPDEPVMLHYAINRPIGATRGESDLGPILVWLRRYRDWLEGRVRLNRFRSAFLWDVEVPDQAVAQTKQKYAMPPPDGSIIVHGPGEKWDAKSANIGADDAAPDGEALRQMVAAGAGVPPHFLSDLGSATQATAHEANAPTLRHYQQRRQVFLSLLGDIVAVAAARAQLAGTAPRRPRVRRADDLKLVWTVADLDPTDNLAVARSGLAAVHALVKAKEQGWVEDEEATAALWRFLDG